MSAHLVRLGLKACPICETGALGVAEKPVILVSGGAAWPSVAHGGERDPDSMTNLMVRVECEVCGHNMLFNVERFHTGDTPIVEPR